MPLGSDDCDHEMVNGMVTDAASAGDSGVGAREPADYLPAASGSRRSVSTI